MNTIHKHFLVLLTISTTVWGNPAIESSIPTADQPSIQKNSLTKESWSKKKIAGLTAAAIFTSSIIAIKGKAQPTQDPQLVLADPLSASVFTPKKTCDSVYFIVKKTCDSDYVFIPRENLKRFKTKIAEEHYRFRTIPQIVTGGSLLLLLSQEGIHDDYKKKILQEINVPNLIEECKKSFYIEISQRRRTDPIIFTNQSENTPDNKANPSTVYLLALALNDKPTADYLFNHGAAYSVVHPSKLPYQLFQIPCGLRPFFGVNPNNKILKEHLALRTPYRTFLTKILLENNVSERFSSFRNKIIYDIGKIIFDFLDSPNGIKLINPRTNIISDL